MQELADFTEALMAAKRAGGAGQVKSTYASGCGGMHHHVRTPDGMESNRCVYCGRRQRWWTLARMVWPKVISY